MASSIPASGTPEADTALAADSAEIPGPLREFWLAYAQSRGALIGVAMVLLLIVLAAGRVASLGRPISSSTFGRICFA